MAETKKSSGSGFTIEERAAMRERNKALKTQQSKEADLAAVLGWRTTIARWRRRSTRSPHAKLLVSIPASGTAARRTKRTAS
jgi:hypothetical protein